MRTVNRHDSEQDFELNLASIIDCFTVLITYLLISASYISLGSLDVAVAVPVLFNPIETPGSPASEVTIDVDSSRVVTVKLSGPEARAWSYPVKNGELDLVSLKDKLTELKGKMAVPHTAILSADKAVVYRDLIKVVETAKVMFPDIAFGDRET